VIRRPAVATALPAVVLIGTLGVAPGVPAQPTNPEQPVAVVTLTTLEPRAPTVTDTLVVRGEIRNVGDTSIRSPRVRLRVSPQPVGSRSALAAQAGSTASFGTVIDTSGAALNLPEIPPGGRSAFTLSTPVAALHLPQLGVYPFGVDLRGDDGTGVETLSRLRTWLPYDALDQPASARVRPTSIAWLWPLVDLPDRNPDGTFPNDALAASIRPTGRLGRLLSAAGAVSSAVPTTPSIPLTFAIDPALLEALAAMTQGYSVRPPGHTAVSGTGRAGAAAFLSQLEQLTVTDPVLALPYADPDLTALERAGLAGDVDIATGSPTFRQLVESVLGTAPLERIAWPPAGLAPRSTIDALTGVDTVVLSGTALPVLPSLSYTPSAATTLPAVGGGTLRAIVSDPTLDGLVAADPARSGGVRLAEQRFLAETLLITAEQPSVSRTVVVAPPRRWAPSAGWADALLRDSAHVPWLRPALVSDLHPAPGASGRGPLVYPPAAQQAELPSSLFAGPGGVRQLGVDLGTLRAIVSNPGAAGIPAMDRALLRCESAAWRTNPDAGGAVRQATRRALRDLVAKVRITTRGEVSLASKKSSIPISVANGLSQPVRISVALHSTAARLITSDTGVRVIAAGHQIQLSVDLQAPSSGVFPMVASLQTPEGQPYGMPVRLLVHSSRYGTLALAITTAAFAVLALIAALRLGRRLLAARRLDASP
jgi:Family of unknown function (DUF6049)